jgi:hypothetical protein
MFCPANDYLPDWICEGYWKQDDMGFPIWKDVSDLDLLWHPTHYMYFPDKPDDVKSQNKPRNSRRVTRRMERIRGAAKDNFR